MSKRPDYYDMMKRPTDGATWDRLEERYGKFETQSTFKKPYQKDEYPEMEFFYPTVPYLPYPSWPYDDGEGYPEYSSTTCGPCVVASHPRGGFDRECNTEDPETGSYAEFHVSIGCIKGPLATSFTEYTWQVHIIGGIGFTAKYCQDVLCHHSCRAPHGIGIEVYPNWDEVEAVNGQKEVEIWAWLTDGFGNICKAWQRIFCKEECCPAEITFEYDSGNPETIVRETSETLTITGGCAPYSWSVSGTGFSLAYSNTEDRQNDLTADDTACGTATISITDDCGTSVTGYVRCTTGGWTQKSTGVCELSGSGTATNGSTFELITDYRKQTQTRFRSGNCGVTDCDTLGTCPAYCDGQNKYYCGDPPPANCIDPEPDRYPYKCMSDGIGGWVVRCYCVSALAYYEWECS